MPQPPQAGRADLAFGWADSGSGRVDSDSDSDSGWAGLDPEAGSVGSGRADSDSDSDRVDLEFGQAADSGRV